MKKRYFFSLFLVLIIMFVLNLKNEWQLDKSGLYVNDKGDVAIAVHRVVAFGHETYYETYYKTYFTHYDETDNFLKDTVDLKTFKILGKTYDNIFTNDLFCVDKNNVYQYYATSCGGNFYIRKNIDKDTLHILNDANYYYADKNSVYYARNGKMNADRKTFVPSKTMPYGKDKNGYFAWGEEVSSEELVAEIKEELDELYGLANKIHKKGIN